MASTKYLDHEQRWLDVSADMHRRRDQAGGVLMGRPMKEEPEPHCQICGAATDSAELFVWDGACSPRCRDSDGEDVSGIVFAVRAKGEE